MTRLERLIIERIEAQGPMPFAAYMAMALYHPEHGYYSSGAERIGWAGHFLTSPELDPAFGELWAAGFEQVWDACGRPESFDVVEIGPGEGSFAAAVLTSARGSFRRALRYRLVERSSSLRDRQTTRLREFDNVEWSASITDVPSGESGCVFANEVLDNLPIHLVEKRDGSLLEVCVEVSEGELAFALHPPPSKEVAAFLDRVGIDLPDGHRFEVTLAAESLVKRAAELLARGAVILVDYGDDAIALAERSTGTLVCYSSAGVDDDPLDNPGSKDITTHANWTAVVAACERAGMLVSGPRPQRDILRALGLDLLHERLRAEHDDAVGTGRGLDAIAALSRRQALGVLADPSGLGGLDVLVACKGIPPPAFAGEPQ